jgi:hypothetical protein
VAPGHSKLATAMRHNFLSGTTLSSFILLLANQSWTRCTSKAEREPPPLHRSTDGLVSVLWEPTIPAPMCSICACFSIYFARFVHLSSFVSPCLAYPIFILYPPSFFSLRHQLPSAAVPSITLVSFVWPGA